MNKVLLVDDDEKIAESFKQTISHMENIEYEIAKSAEEAIKIMKKTLFAVVISDIDMPQRDGIALLNDVKELFPLTVRMIITEKVQLQQLIMTVNQNNVFRFLTKPWDDDKEMIPAIKDAIEYHEAKLLHKHLEMANQTKKKAYNNMLANISENIDFNTICFRNVAEIITICMDEYVKELSRNFSDEEYQALHLFNRDGIEYCGKILSDPIKNVNNFEHAIRDKFEDKKHDKNITLKCAFEPEEQNNSSFLNKVDYALWLIFYRLHFLFSTYNAGISIKKESDFYSIIVAMEGKKESKIADQDRFDNTRNQFLLGILKMLDIRAESQMDNGIYKYFLKI